ncbi:MAG: thioredoxin [Bacteroidales bacterium]|jgi:thioredoxin|nr:thioredoxin [Bacteroidales bacterium]MDD2576219.1 thioredoxin [Bacteroidales bacterium]MDD4068459.1 thioredoxin [Bacteroidales bacterium]MDD4738610.1 thioredoxin [Bacteroidales bacterium]MDY4790597.1 thioredoxin [Bacteroidales bacterium]
MRRKIILMLMLATITFISCGNSTDKEKQTKEEQKNSTINKKENKMKTINLSKSEFLTKVMNFEQNPQEWKYLGDKPCIIDFYADWCGPCKMVAPLLEELAKEYDGEIYVYKIDTEKEQELAQAFGIRSIPSLLFVPMNEQPQMVMGALPKSELKKAIDDILLKK